MYNIVPENSDLTAVPRLTKQAMDKLQVWNREPMCSECNILRSGVKPLRRIWLDTDDQAELPAEP